jgi:hypothetical protein
MYSTPRVRMMQRLRKIRVPKLKIVPTFMGQLATTMLRGKKV